MQRAYGATFKSSYNIFQVYFLAEFHELLLFVFEFHMLLLLDIFSTLLFQIWYISDYITNYENIFLFIYYANQQFSLQ